MKTNTGIAATSYPRSVSERALGIILGLGETLRHGRALWAARVTAGSILMLFGLLFSHPTNLAATDAVLPGMAYAMIAAGAMIAVGFLTRIVSLALAVMLTVAVAQSGAHSMMGLAEMTCIGLSLFSLACGSGPQSVDTQLARFLTSVRK